MIKFDGLLDHYMSTAATMSEDIAFWRKFNIRMQHNDQDVTESWLEDKQGRLYNLLRVIAAHEKLGD